MRERKRAANGSAKKVKRRGRRRRLVLLKLSGEALGSTDALFNLKELRRFAMEIKAALKKGVNIAIVVGGGNIIRGALLAAMGMKRTPADYAGMLATMQNGLALKDMLRQCGVDSRLMTGVRCDAVAEPFIQERAIRHLQKRRVLIFVGGTGNPYCTTDYAAALRAAEIEADLLVKATDVDGVYDKDPNKHTDAKLYAHVTYDTALHKKLKVLDSEAFVLCSERKIPIRVFSLKKPGNITKVLLGKSLGTLVDNVESLAQAA